MSTSYKHTNGGDHILRPRPLKPGNPVVLRAMSEERSGLKPNGNTADSDVASGISRYDALSDCLKAYMLTA